MGDGTRPLPVAAHGVEALQRVVETALDLEPCAYLSVGQRVRVDAGPLRGTEGIVIRVNQRARSNGWLRLGRFDLKGPVPQVVLHNQPELRTGDAISYDAVAFAPVG